MKDIPGFLSKKEQIELIKLLYKYNHHDCIGVEIGSLHGRSSYPISIAIDKGKLYCIDPWGNHLILHKPDANGHCMQLPNSLDAFLKNTEDRKNIIPIQGCSPSVVKEWINPIDFIFLDALHENPSDRDNIDFWLPKIKPGGMFLGHDWFENAIGPDGDIGYPDVNLNVEYMEDLLKQKVNIIPETSIWYFQLPKF